MDNTSKNVILYGAGEQSVRAYDHIKTMGLSPVCFCDADKSKQHRKRMLRDGDVLDVLSVDEALAEYNDAMIYVTPIGSVRSEIMDGLINERKIARERIVNGKGYGRRKSCKHLEEDLLVQRDKIYFCCLDAVKVEVPSVDIAEDMRWDEMWTAFARTRDEIIESLNDDARPRTPCHGCRFVKEDRYCTELQTVTVDFPSVCQFNCVYCDWNFKTSMCADRIKDTKRLLGFFKYLEGNQKIGKDVRLVIASGEITIHPMRDEILRFFGDYACRIFTNAHVYDEKIAEMLSFGGSSLYVSVDAGTSETFANVKGVDCFWIVCENLLRYAESGPVELKYIVLPGLNDNVADLDGFMDLCVRTNARLVILSRDLRKMEKSDAAAVERILPLLARFVFKARERGLIVDVAEFFDFGDCRYSEKISKNAEAMKFISELA
jgi:pyruvate-formate lyase-activating enzyme